jgi:hypothetical protein
LHVGTDVKPGRFISENLVTAQVVRTAV